MIAASTASGSIKRYSGSTSTKTGTAPIREAASAVAMKVFAGMMTSSPAPTPTARKASSRASVPLDTPTTCPTPMYSAYSSSKAVTSGPPMKRSGGELGIPDRQHLGSDFGLLRGDVEERNLLRHALRQIKIEALDHLASTSQVRPIRCSEPRAKRRSPAPVRTHSSGGTAARSECCQSAARSRAGCPAQTLKRTAAVDGST